MNADNAAVESLPEDQANLIVEVFRMLADVTRVRVLVALTGGVLAIFMMVYSGRVRRTMFNVMQFFYGLLPGQHVPRFEIPADRRYTLPYAVPICFGSLVSYFLFHV